MRRAALANDTNGNTPGGVASIDKADGASNRTCVMAGTKDEGVGHAKFHAVRTDGNRYRVSACGQAACGTLVPLSEAPEELRCRSAGCRAAFRLGA